METGNKEIDAYYKHALKASRALEKAIEKLKKEEDHLDNETKEMYFDSIIQRFELTYETFWKYLKEYISLRHGLALASPWATFRQCFKVDLISQQKAEELDDVANAHNITTHLYSQIMSRNMVKNLIPTYCILIKKLLGRISP